MVVVSGFSPGPVVLEGPGFRLEPLDGSHAAGVVAAGSDAATFEHMAIGPFARVAEAEAWIAAASDGAARAGDVPWAILDTRGANPVVAGSTRLLAVRPPHRGCEIGWTWLGTAWRGSGLNACVKRAILAHLFEQLGAVRVEFKTDARNERSQRAMLAIGCVREGVHRRHMLRRDGTMRDSVYFSITDEEWPGVRTRLDARIRTGAWPGDPSPQG